MKRRLVRFLFEIGCHKLAHRISPSLYDQCVRERFVKECMEATDAIATYVAAQPQKEEE